MIFEEKQDYRMFLWAMLPFPIIILVVILIVAGQSDTAERNEAFIALLVVVAVEIPIILLFLRMRLETRIDKNGITYGMFPFVKQKALLWSEVEKAWVRKYKPLAEYGGWGLKGNLRRKEKAYNVWGNKGLQVYLASGKRLMIGTQKADELAAFLERLKEKHGIPPIQKAELNG